MIGIVFENKESRMLLESLDNICRQSALGGGEVTTGHSDDSLVGDMSDFSMAEARGYKAPVKTFQPKQVSDEVRQIRVCNLIPFSMNMKFNLDCRTPCMKLLLLCVEIPMSRQRRNKEPK